MCIFYEELHHCRPNFRMDLSTPNFYSDLTYIMISNGIWILETQCLDWNTCFFYSGSQKNPNILFWSSTHWDFHTIMIYLLRIFQWYVDFKNPMVGLGYVIFHKIIVYVGPPKTEIFIGSSNWLDPYINGTYSLRDFQWNSGFENLMMARSQIVSF